MRRERVGRSGRGGRGGRRARDITPMKRVCLVG